MVWDPLRKKEVAATPEERVRQWFIGVLKSTAGVPEHMMRSEVGLGERALRADIVIYDREARPAAVVECKREEVTLTREVLEQGLKYFSVLQVRYIIITNGRSTYAFGRENGGFRQLDTLPSYAEMVGGKHGTTDRKNTNKQ